MCRQVPQPESGFRVAPGSRRVCVPPAHSIGCFQLKLGANLKEARRLLAGASTEMGRGGEGEELREEDATRVRTEGCKCWDGMVEAGETLPCGLESNTSIPKMLDIRCLCRGGRPHIVPPMGCPILLLHQQHDANSMRLADMAQDLLDPGIKGF